MDTMTTIPTAQRSAIGMPTSGCASHGVSLAAISNAQGTGVSGIGHDFATTGYAAPSRKRFADDAVATGPQHWRPPLT